MRTLFGFAALFLFAAVSVARAETVLLQDNFSQKDTQTWQWTTSGSTSSSVGEGLGLLVTPGADDHTYSDAEIVSVQSFTQKNLEVVAVSPALEQGSRGWGFWNWTTDLSQSELAFFLYRRGAAGDPANGFYAWTQKAGQAQDYHQLDDKLLSEPHTYSITWSASGLAYLIDGVVVYQPTGYPTGPMKADAWNDNEVCVPGTFNPTLLPVVTSAPLTIQSVKITDPN